MKTKKLIQWGIVVPLSISALTGYSANTFAADIWSLQSSVERVLEVSPETRASLDILAIRETQQQQSTAWPNPQIEVRADQSMGLDDGSGGYDINELVISQPIPVNRIQHQSQLASAQLSASRSQGLQQQLMLEYKTAMVFHQLQLKNALYDLSQQRLKIADKYGKSQQSTQAAGQLVRYLTPLEQKRLSILRETARQATAYAEGELNEVLSEFRILLNMPQTTQITLEKLKLISESVDLMALLQRLESHPQLQSLQHNVQAAQAQTDVAKASRYKDPTVNLFIERDNFNNQRETYSGISVNMELPLWNENSQDVSLARAQLINSQTEHQIKRRELSSQLQQSYLHYGHLIKQIDEYRRNLLKPAEDMFKLSQKSFSAGEENILGLIDSYNSYFEIHAGYLKLLASAAQELASVRMAAGISLFASTTVNGGAK